MESISATAAPPPTPVITSRASSTVMRASGTRKPTPATNCYHPAQSFNVAPGLGRCHWCDNKLATPTPLGYDSCGQYFDQNNVGAWGWCAEQDPESVGFVCIPAEGHPGCN